MYLQPSTLILKLRETSSVTVLEAELCFVRACQVGAESYNYVKSHTRMIPKTNLFWPIFGLFAQHLWRELLISCTSCQKCWANGPKMGQNRFVFGIILVWLFKWAKIDLSLVSFLCDSSQIWCQRWGYRSQWPGI